MSDAPRRDQQGPSGWPAGPNLVCLTMISSNHTSAEDTGLRAKRRVVKNKSRVLHIATKLMRPC